MAGLIGTAAALGAPAVRLEHLPSQPEPSLAKFALISQVTDGDTRWKEGCVFTNIAHRVYRFAPQPGVEIDRVLPLTPELAIYTNGHTLVLTNTEIPTNRDMFLRYGTARFEVAYRQDGTNGAATLDVPLTYEFQRIPVTLDANFEPGSLAHNLHTNVAGRIAGKSPAPAKPLLAYPQGWLQWYAKTVWNPNCWLNVPGKTSFSIGNYYDRSPASNNAWYQGAGTLITPRHLITAGHMCWPPFTNHWYRFLDSNNVPYDRRIVAVVQCTSDGTRKVWTDGAPMSFNRGVMEGPDTALTLLDRDLPPSVVPAPFLDSAAVKQRFPHFDPRNFAFKLPQAAPPLWYVQMDQGKNARIANLSSGTYELDPDWNTGPGPGGNSGSPGYVLINNDLALFGIGWSGPWIVTNVANLCHSNNLPAEKYRLRYYDLSGFKDYAR